MSKVLEELKEIEKKLVNMEQEFWSIGISLEHVRYAIFHYEHLR